MRKTSFKALTWLLAVLIFQLAASSSEAVPRKKRVLYLGDSMSMGAFGETLDLQMRDAGFDVYTFVAGGATPYYWLSRYSTISGPLGYWEKTPTGEHRRSVVKAVPKIEKLLERYDPDIVVVQTGTNLYSTLRSKRRSKESNVKEVEGLLNHMVEAATQGGRKCFWITPPEAHVGRYPVELQLELAELTKRVVGREAEVFDSRKVTRYIDPYPENDGIHYGPTEARKWAKSVASDFNQFVGGGKRRAQGLLAARRPSAPDLSAEIIAMAPRAQPVKRIATNRTPSPQPEPIPAKEEKPPVKVEAAAKPPVEQMQPPSKPAASKPPAKPAPVASKPAKRPPVQYVKKAIPVEVEGAKWGKLDLEVELVAKSELKSLTDIDYSYCFAMNEYRVLKVNSGRYPYPNIRIARVVMWGKKLVPAAIDEQVGFRPRGGWELVPMSDYPSFERMQLVDELEVDFDMPTYIIAFE